MKGGGVESTIVPEAVLDSVKRSLVNLEDVRVQLIEFFTLSDPDILAELPPLCRAQALVLLAKATSSLLSLRLRCNGVQPDDHPIKTEWDLLRVWPPLEEKTVEVGKHDIYSGLLALQLCVLIWERLSLYQEKVERCMTLSKAPLRPSTSLNFQAATRFIEHSLPDLTAEQRQSMRDISKGKGVKDRQIENRSSEKKRKYQSYEKQSVRTAAQEFLEKATRELLGDNKGGLKGPIRIMSSDEEDSMMD